MKKVIIIAGILLAAGALACFIFLRYFSHPLDKTGMINGYDVEYDDFFFSADKSSHFYPVGDEVRLCFGLIASDTDYSFIVDGAEEYNVSFSNEEGYIITFTMPANPVKVSYEMKNSMLPE